MAKEVKDENDSLTSSNWAKLDWTVPVWVLIDGGFGTDCSSGSGTFQLFTLIICSQ